MFILIPNNFFFESREGPPLGRADMEAQRRRKRRCFVFTE